MSRIGGGEHGAARGDALLSQAEVHVVGRQQAEAAVVMGGVVPGEELVPVGTGVLDRAKAIGERRPVLEGLELRLRERVVVGDVRAAVWSYPGLVEGELLSRWSRHPHRGGYRDSPPWVHRRS